MTEVLTVEGVAAALWTEDQNSSTAADLDSRLRHLRRIVDTRNPSLRRDLGLRQDPLELRESAVPTIRTIGIAGSLDLGVVRLEIAPKYSRADLDPLHWQENLIALMEFASRRKVSFATVDVSAYSATTFADRVAFVYAESLRRARSGPPIRDYRSVEQEGRTLRGRLRVTAQVRLSLRRPDLVAFERSELDTDNAYNRLLRWAAARLISSTRDASVRRRLEYELRQLPAGAHDSPPTRLPGLAPRQYAHYDEALALASGVRIGRGPTRGSSSTLGADFVVGTERLFESFVERRISEVAARRVDWAVIPQHRSQFAISRNNRRAYFSQPDNLLTTSAGTGLVIDAKYKRFADAVEETPGRPSNSDIYQMVAACVAHHQPRALLLYPLGLAPHVQEPTEIDPPVSSVVWWETQLAPGKHVNVGASCVNVSLVRNLETLAQFDSNLEQLIEAAMNTKLEAIAQ